MSSQDSPAARAGRNELLLQEASARHVELNEALSVFPRSPAFFCECGRSECTDRIEIGAHEYGAIRTNPRHFVIAPSTEHYADAFDGVVAMRRDYWVVEKSAREVQGLRRRFGAGSRSRLPAL